MTHYHSPYARGGRWLRGNLHAHTSCGRFMDVSESGPMYASLGYDFLAVTDHNEAPADGRWRRWQEEVDLILIPGEENGATDHILEIGVRQVTETGSKDYVERARALREGGGFVIGCHPQEYDHGPDNVRAAAPVLHAFEIYNGLREARGTDESRNVALWDELLTAGHRIWGVASDDFHCQYITPGHGWVCVQVPHDARPVTWQTIVDQLKAGAFYASTYPTFHDLRLDGDTLRVRADHHTKKIHVVGPGGEVIHGTGGRSLTWRPPAGLAYFRVEAVSGVKRAWSQPFFRPISAMAKE